jgi:hypothetical protein
MTFKAHIKNGVAVLDDGVQLPEGTEVRVEAAPSQPAVPLSESFKSLIGKVEDLPADAAANKRHYLYGTPRHDRPTKLSHRPPHGSSSMAPNSAK